MDRQLLFELLQDRAFFFLLNGLSSLSCKQIHQSRIDSIHYQIDTLLGSGTILRHWNGLCPCFVIRLSCFGIISVSFRCQFASSPRCRSSPESHSGVSLPLVRSFRSGFLHIPAKSHGTTSPGKHIPHRLVIRLE